MNGLSDMVNREKKDVAQIVVWNGLNRTDGATDGYLSDCLNLTSDNYPTLSPRKGRGVIETYSDPTSLYSWDKLVVIDNGILYYDGDPIANVSPGEKQFAVVGSRLCVWPDELIIDLQNGESFNSNVSMTTTGTSGSVSFTSDTITATANAKEKANIVSSEDDWGTFNQGTEFFAKIMYTYGSHDDPADVAALEACYNNGWNTTSLEALEEIHALWWTSVPPAYSSGRIEVGMMFIPKKINSQYVLSGYGLVTGRYDWDGSSSYPSKTYLSTEGGHYAVVTDVYHKYSDDRTYVEYDVYAIGALNPLFSSMFYVGDTVNVEGTRYGWYDREKIIVTAISDYPNKLTVGAGTYYDPTLCYIDGYNSCQTGKNYLTYGSGNNVYEFTLTTAQADEAAKDNTVLFLVGTSPNFYVVFWDTANKRERFSVAATQQASASSGSKNLGAGTAYSTDTLQVTISRAVPQLDFVCAWNNRLWGVSNDETNRVWNEEKEQWEETHSRVIYGSALGMPWQFYDYSGLSTDSYASVVASKGEFTGISAYSRSLCCFKENMLYRVSGDYPADYFVYDYNVAGVMAGCHKSLKIVNEVLYYKGRDGFYAYSGSTPRLISYVLGENNGTAHATADERKYYAALNYGASGEILVYDTITQTWYKEDDTVAGDMTYNGGHVYFIANGKIYKADDPSSTEEVEWSATFVRANETFHERKDYKWLRIRADMANGSTLKAEVSIDRGEWITVLPTTTINGLKMIEMPIRNNRVDEYVLRLSGTGQGKIRSVIREFLEGSTAR